MNKLIKRQLKRFVDEDLRSNQALLDFANAVSEAYDAYEQDIELLQRSIEISSEELLAANRQMRTIFKAIPDIILLVNQDLQILSCHSENTDNVFETPHVVGKQLSHLCDTSFAQLVQTLLLEVKSDNATHRSVEYAPVDNSGKYFELTAASVGQSDFILIIRDISIRKRQEFDRQQDFRRISALNDMLSHLPELFKTETINLDELLEITLINSAELHEAAAIDLLIFAREFDNYGFAKRFYTKERRLLDLIDVKSESSSEADQKLKHTIWLPLKIGNEEHGHIKFYFEEEGSRRNENNEKQFYTAISNLLTLALSAKAQQSTQMALKESRQRFKTLSETSTSIIVVYTYTILYVNPAFCELFKVKAEHCIGRTIEQFFGDKLAYEPTEQNTLGNQEIQVFPEKGTHKFLYLSNSSIDYDNQKAKLLCGIDITERKRYEQELSKKAYYDGLTGIPNREYLMMKLDQRIRQFREKNNEFAIVFINIDRFKVINDCLGIEIGDKLLCMISKRIIRATESADTVSRIASDEFVILINKIRHKEQLFNLIQILREEFNRRITIDFHEIQNSVSIGAYIAHDPEECADQYIRKADIALYHTKKLGRGSYQLFDADMLKKIEENRKLESEIQKALENNEFSSHYQPIICLNTFRTVGFESLSRWSKSQELGVNPQQYISLMEESGFINLFSQQGIDSLIEEVTDKLMKFPLKPYVSFNLSGINLIDKKFIQQLMNYAKASPFIAEFIRFEITENVLIDDIETATKHMNQLNDCGYKLMLDDFGTGYSSLGYLHQLPLDYIKIDKSFIDDLLIDQSKTQIVKSIIELAHSLNKCIIAEGVENLDQVRILQQFKCDYVQGYFFSRPKDKSELKELAEKEWLINVPENAKGIGNNQTLSKH